MKNIDKKLIFNIYSKLSILIGLGTFLILFTYFGKFPEGMYGAVDRGIFSLDFNVSPGINIEIFNSPLVWFIGFFLLNLGFLIYSLVGDKEAVGTISGSLFYNLILSVLLIIAQLVFYYLVPETVNGPIEIGLFEYEFAVLSDVSNTGYNFGYALASIYTFYNVFMVYVLTRNSETDFGE